MHDFHIANKIVKLVLKKAKKSNLKTVSKITIGLGKIIEHGEYVNPDNLKFNIKMLAKGSIAENTKVSIYPIKDISFTIKEVQGF